MKSLIWSVVKTYALYGFLIVGVIYVAWHLGRSYEVAKYASSSETSQGMAVMCNEYYGELICETRMITAEKFVELYEEILRELNEPTPKSKALEDFKDFQAIKEEIIDL